MAVALFASLLVLTQPPTAVGAQEPPPGVTTSTSWVTDCIGRALGVGQQQQNSMSFDVIAPAQVEPNETFTIRIVPQQSAFPDKNPSPVGEVTVNRLLNIQFMYNLPTNATTQSVAIVPGTAQGISGTPTVEIDSVSFPSPRIVLRVPEVPKNMTPPTNETFFRLPAIDVVVQATGAVGSNIATRVSGRNEATSGYVFQADSAALADVRCWPLGEVNAPVMSQTAISSGSVTVPTTTELAVDPTTVPGGGDVTMTATVSAPTGVVRFNDGTTVLGFAELDEESVATLTAPLNTIGDRSITATYLGAPGFDASVSAPVAVTVTDPADRTGALVTTTLLNSRIAADPGSVNNPKATATVTVAPTDGGLTPTGSVRLYANAELVGTQPLVDGSVTFTAFSLPFGPAGYQIRAEYLGDTDYFPGTGSAPLIAALSNGPGLDLPLSTDGEILLNGVSSNVPSDSDLISSFRTGSTGVETLSGVLSFASTTFTGPAGSVTGRLAQVGTGTGQIAAGADAVATFDAQAYLQVESADLGTGPQTFASTCAVGPFSVSLTGTRAGTDGLLTLAGSGFSVPFAPVGSCVDSTGVSRAAGVGAALAGAQTDLSLVLTPPAPGAPTTVSAVTANPAGGATFGQPVTLTATVSTMSPNSLSTAGAIRFYAGSVFLGEGLIPFSAPPTVSLSFPFGGVPGIVPARPAIPQGVQSLRAEFVPNATNKNIFADSPLSPPTSYTVLPPTPTETPTLTLDVPETAPVGQPVTVSMTLSPAPNDVPGAAQLSGTILLFDRSAPAGQQQVPIVPNNFTAGTIDVSPTDDGNYSTQMALASGVHNLEAVFTPAVEAQWGWTAATSNTEVHTVVGEPIPTSVSIIDESTRGTGQVPLNQPVYLRVRIDPRVMAGLGPEPVQLWYIRPDGALLSVTADSVTGEAVVTVTGTLFNNTVGQKSFTLNFNPGIRGAGGEPQYAGNLGFAPSSVTFEYEVVTPGNPGPMPTGLQVVTVNPAPAVEGTPWSQVNGFVTYNAAGSVSYFARNTATAQTTPLGSANVNVTTSATTGRGLARLANPAATASLSAGTYEVWGVYTPTNPVNFAPAQSAPFTVHVVDPDAPVATTTELAVFPEGISAPGAGVLLAAGVTPGDLAPGTIEFFDGETSLGVTTTLEGTASLLTYSLAEGEHSLTAVFTPSNPTVVQGSTSEAVTHVVAEPAVPTTTDLAITPLGPTPEGSEVTFMATVEPAEAVGTVVFEDEHGELGEVELDEGTAVLVTDELEVGDHIFTATFVPADPAEFAESTSPERAHVVTANSTPGAPTNVSATAGGLMATVTWTPGTPGSSPTTSYTVTASPGGTEVVVSGDVTTVDVIGLTQGETYTFTVVATNAVGDSPASAPSDGATIAAPTVTFSDVSSNHTFFNEITWMAEVGLSTGFDDGTYKPALTLSRQAMSAFIYRLNGSQDGAHPTCSEAPFTDVPTSNPFCGEIAWMKAEGIAEGNPDGSFGPTVGLTRAAMSAFLYRSADSPDGEDPTCTTPPFTDVPVTNPFCGEIQWMKETGISTGTVDGKYLPAEQLTRGAMSAFLYRYTLVIQTDIV